MKSAVEEIKVGKRFAFGDNWRSFLALLDDQRIEDAVSSLRSMLGVEDLTDKRFLDAGSGSGLFSLAARKLGAHVVSFDFDPSSVACTAELRSRYFPDESFWQVSTASVLDMDFLSTLGTFDVVYSWGVLHHTGNMWAALENVINLVQAGGRLYISIYNDQGARSRMWTRVKRQYSSSGPVGRWVILHGVDLMFRAYPLRLASSLYRQFKRRPKQEASRPRGMDRRHDLVDWVGGYPFEVAKPDDIFDYCHHQGFALDRMKLAGGGLGCNQFVFTKS